MTLPAKAPAENKIISWRARQQQLLSLSHWTLRGAIGVKQQQKGFNAQMHWQQNDLVYQIRLFGPLGGGLVQLQGSPEQVTLITSDKKLTHANNAEQLLQRQTGWRLPIDNLNFWIRGLAAPTSKAEKQMDRYQHIRTLKQQGWNIQFQRYTQVKGIDLPSKMTLYHGDLRIRIIIKQWLF